MDEHSAWKTDKGDEVTLYIEQEAKVCQVTIEHVDGSYTAFNFNPDFPQDAKTFFKALQQVQSITIE